ncbi:MAG: YraN family protein [Helicobacter sp.]|nr:YraN family protein [Helicobacter sp.]
MNNHNHSRIKGNLAEQKAVAFLEHCGFSIINQNVFSRFGEIDIIATKDNVLHFIEVKSGVNFDPIHALTPKKMSRIQKTIESYILENELTCAFCIDLVCVRGENYQDIELFENVAF